MRPVAFVGIAAAALATGIAGYYLTHHRSASPPRAVDCSERYGKPRDDDPRAAHLAELVGKDVATPGPLVADPKRAHEVGYEVNTDADGALRVHIGELSYRPDACDPVPDDPCSCYTPPDDSSLCGGLAAELEKAWGAPVTAPNQERDPAFKTKLAWLDMVHEKRARLEGCDLTFDRAVSFESWFQPLDVVGTQVAKLIHTASFDMPNRSAHWTVPGLGGGGLTRVTAKFSETDHTLTSVEASMSADPATFDFLRGRFTQMFGEPEETGHRRLTWKRKNAAPLTLFGQEPTQIPGNPPTQEELYITLLFGSR